MRNTPPWLYGAGAALLLFALGQRRKTVASPNMEQVFAENQKNLARVKERNREAVKKVAAQGSPIPNLEGLDDTQIRYVLAKIYHISPQEIDDFMKGWDRMTAIQDSYQIPGSTRRWTGTTRQYGLSLHWPEWLSWDLFSWDTLSTLGKAAWEDVQEYWSTPEGIAAVVSAIVIGPEILAFYGFTGAEAATYGVMDYLAAAQNAKGLIQGAMNSGNATVAVFSGQVWEAYLTGGPEASFLRQLMANLAGNQVAFAVEHGGQL